MDIYKAGKADGEFIFHGLSEMMDQAQFSLDAFLRFFEKYIQLDNSSVYIAVVDGERVGLATLNRYPILRFIGYAYEIEEYLIVEKHRRKGYGKEFLQMLIKMCKQDAEARKILVKTNGDDSRSLYAQYMRITDYTSYQEFLNKV